MIKFVCLLTRKPGMSRADFINYYENRHAKLAIKLLPATYSAYRRNYVEQAGPLAADVASLPPFDVITELEFPDREAFDRFMASAALPANAEAIAKDEENLFDRSKSRFFTADVHSSPLH